MNLGALIFGVVFRAGCSKVTFSEKINLEVVRQQGPNSKIKLSSLVQQWLFDVLLNYPKSFTLVFLKDKVVYIIQRSKHRNASSLIEGSWFYYPHVLCTMLKWNSFMLAAPRAKLLKPLHELINFSLFRRSCYDERCWS